jgi:3-deoxy-D-manno-octulosonate 8-phosphate phosphatase (KDO 8-P phosphatase)
VTDPGVAARAARIRLVGLDVDGVLTDGRLFYGPQGDELKSFHVRDGLGLQMLRASGVEVAVISARSSEALARRVRDLRIQHAFLGCDDKLSAIATLRAQLELELDQVCFVGDDILDLPVLRVVGLAVTVADAHPLVRAVAHLVTSLPGGSGAVRELTDLLLARAGSLAEATDAYLASRIAAAQGRTEA